MPRPLPFLKTEGPKVMTDEPQKNLDLEITQYHHYAQDGTHSIGSLGVRLQPPKPRPDEYNFNYVGGYVYTPIQLTNLLTRILSALKELGCEIELKPAVPATEPTFTIKVPKPSSPDYSKKEFGT